MKHPVKTWIVMDLDGTLCDCSHRVHLAQAKEWDEFHAGIPHDKPKQDMVEFLKILPSYIQLLLCTGRDEKHRGATWDWLTQNDLALYFDDLVMRPPDSRKTDGELKVWLVDEFFEGRENALEQVLVVLDDRDPVVLAFREAGFMCWQVNSGEY